MLLPHRREDLITRLAPVIYSSEARCPIWVAFLDKIMKGDEALNGFLQRAGGYALTGDVSEQILIILYGAGSNGKSTFINTILGLLGPYGIKAASDLLMLKKGETHPTERADLCGRRFVAAVESEEGRRLSEVFVKEATGSDPIRARRMREDFWEFLPTHKIWLATNHKPVIKGTDHAMWRRPKLIPFKVTIPDEDQDKELAEKLRSEWSGILTWAVQGCLDWQKYGLSIPDPVKQATAAYRGEMDVIGRFIEDRCVQGSDKQSPTATLYAGYEHWCDNEKEKPIGKTEFGRRLGERGFAEIRIGHDRTRGWRGIGLRHAV